MTIEEKLSPHHTRQQRMEYMRRYWEQKRVTITTSESVPVMIPVPSIPYYGKSERDLVNALTGYGLIPLRFYWEFGFFCYEFHPVNHEVRQIMNRVLSTCAEQVDKELAPFDRYYDRINNQTHPHCYRARFFVSQKITN